MTPQPPHLRQICAWCPDFDPRDPANKGASHTMCSSCARRLDAELDRLARTKAA